ncbi:exodeoxyribonuclease III [Patescibacteria group bacterium]|nr:exodeoxyribonuclease III [Patescibacteria group bacterium]
MSKNIKIVSWNVNGIRAALKKDFMNWFKETNADIVCLQETKLSNIEQLPHQIVHPDEYASCWSCSIEKKGYSGVAIFSKIKPKKFITQFKQTILNKEGRVIGAEYENFILFNVYFPNGGRDRLRVPYKLDFYEAFLEMINSYKKRGKKIIFCGDVNTAHQEIDLARPKQNEKNTGFLPEERAWIDRLIYEGYIDTFREFDKNPENYTWWDMKTGARARNVGWRIDYFFVSQNLKSNLSKAYITPKIIGSDHCPIYLEIKK